MKVLVEIEYVFIFWHNIFPTWFYQPGSGISTTKTIPYYENRNNNYQIAEPSDLLSIFHHFVILKSQKNRNSQQVKFQQEILIQIQIFASSSWTFRIDGKGVIKFWY